MKHLVWALAGGVVLAGSAFAADAKISLNYRSRLEVFAQDQIDEGVKGQKKKTTTEWMDWQDSGYNGASSDTFKFVLSSDRAGVTLAFNTANNKKGGDGFFTLNEYSAWMKFDAGPGTLRLTTGNWKDGYLDGAYRVKKDVDAQNAEGIDFERFKLGSIFSGTKALNFVDDLAFSTTLGGGNEYTLGMADYDFKVNDDLSLNFLVGGRHSNNAKFFDTKTNSSGTKTTTWKSAFVSRVQVGMKGLLNAELIYKKPAPRVDAFALYVMPQVMDELTLNVGGGAEFHTKDDTKIDEKYTDWAFDIRARYQVNDALSVTFFTNVSGTDLDKGRNINSGIAGSDGKKGWTQTATLPDSTGAANKTKAAFKTAMWNNISARYKINDIFTASLNLGCITPLSDLRIQGKDGKYHSYSYDFIPEWRVTPGVQISASSNASVWAAVALSGSKMEDYEVFNFSVPVIFRVKM